MAEKKITLDVKKETPKKKEVKKIEHSIAKASSFGLPISAKFSYEILNFIKHKELAKAKGILHEVISMKKAIPFKRYNRDLGHKPGIGPGRYPIKAIESILSVLDSAEANAENLGLDVKNLYIYGASASLGSRPWHGGRKRRRQMKRTNLTIMVKEKLE